MKVDWKSHETEDAESGPSSEKEGVDKEAEVNVISCIENMNKYRFCKEAVPVDSYIDGIILFKK